MKTPSLSFIILLLIALALPATAFNITATNISTNFIKWGWDNASVSGNVTGLNIDGKLITNFDPNSSSYILTNIGADELHQITVYTDVGNGSASTYTSFGDNTWGWVLLTIVFFLLGRYLHYAFFFVGSGVSLYGLASWMQEFEIQATDIWHLPYLIFLFLFVFGFFLWAFRKRR